MWALRLLTGPSAGQIFYLKSGTNTIGRAPQCEVKLPSNGVSKEHAKIDVLNDKIIVADLGSRNGTFVNGVQIKSQRVENGDKIAFHDLILEVHQVSAQALRSRSAITLSAQTATAARTRSGALTAVQEPVHAPAPAAPEPQPLPVAAYEPATPLDLHKPPPSIRDISPWMHQYSENVILPGVYRLAELLELRYVLMGFLALFLFVTTSLSTIPLMTILKSSIEKESQRRALTIARTLAQINRPALMQGIDSALTVEIAMREPGVEKALIISSVDGNILAPSSQAGTFANLPYIHEARRNGKEAVEQVSGSKIVALVPIEFFHAETGNNQVTADAVVIYDMGTLAVDDGRTLSLFIQTLMIAILIGGIIFFFMYKLIEHPLKKVNEQLDQALRDGSQDIATTFRFPVLEALVSNINSALNRVQSQPSGIAAGTQERDRHSEMTNLVELMGFAALAVTAHDNAIAAVNQPFEERTGLSSATLMHSSIDKIADQALKLSIQDLVERLTQNPDQVATNELEFGGNDFQIAGQAVYGNQKVAYFIFVILPAAEGGA